MPQTERNREYWRKNLCMTVLLLTIWFVVTFVVSYFARELNRFFLFDFPFGFYMAAQGSLIVFLAIVAAYAYYMNRLDEAYGVETGEEGGALPCALVADDG